MDGILQDFRYALRQLGKTPGFTATAICVLSLGLGAATAIFGLANWVALRPTPGVRQSSHLVVAFFENDRHSPGILSYPALQVLQAAVPAFSSLTAEQKSIDVALAGEGRTPRPIHASFVPSNFFDVLGVRFARGRMFSREEEDIADQQPVAVISYDLWESDLGRDEAVLEKSLRINGHAVRVVGVAVKDFTGSSPVTQSRIWFPGYAISNLASFGMSHDMLRLPRIGLFPELIGRLNPGMTPAVAESQLRTAAIRIASEFPNDLGYFREMKPIARRGLGLDVRARDGMAETLKLLGEIGAVVLLIAIANSANLMLFRAARRRGEYAVRNSLGAGRGRLLFQSTIESTILAFASGVLALGIAAWLVSAFRGINLPYFRTIEQIDLDWRVLIFGIATAVVVGILLGVLTHVSLGRSELSGVLKSSTTRVSSRTPYLRGALAVIQLAASLTLLVGSFLLATTLRNLRAIDPGMDVDRLSAFSLNLGVQGYSDDGARPVIRELVSGIRRIPGVDRVAVSYRSPFEGISFGNRIFAPPVVQGNPGLSVTVTGVYPGYFETMGIRLLSGRDFVQSELDRAANPSEDIAIISEGVAKTLFGTTDVVGRVLEERAATQANPSATRPYRVIGVVADSRWTDLTGRGQGPMLYHLFGERSNQAYWTTSILIRGTAAAAHLEPLIKAEAAKVAPDVPVREVASMRNRIDQILSEQVLFARVSSILTFVAIVLTVVGLYGLISFSVVERTREFGIRIALGSEAAMLIRMVLGQASLLGLAGLAAGSLGAVVASRLLASRLFGVQPLEPWVYIGATSGLMTVALVASLLPARAATRVDPIICLRSE